MASSSSVSLKLLIDKKAQKVLFAEAGKDFVDFLFYILSLPVGTVIRLVDKNSMVGCLGNLYRSIENFNETYFLPSQTKDKILTPKVSFGAAEVPLLLKDSTDSVSRKLYGCDRCYYIADDPNALCPECKKAMTGEVTYVTSDPSFTASSSEGGFVKGVVTYMIMDDLVVEPMSTISSITVLNKFNVKEVGSLEEKVVHLGMAEGLKLLKASFQCNSVLTKVFLA